MGPGPVRPPFPPSGLPSLPLGMARPLGTDTGDLSSVQGAVQTPVAVRIPRARPPAKSHAVAESPPFALGPGEVLLRTFRPEPRFVFREFLGGDGIVLLGVLALGTFNTFELFLFQVLPGLVPGSMLAITLAAGVYFALEARSTCLHQAVWVTDERVVHGYGVFRPRFRSLGLGEMVPGEVERRPMDRLFALARLSLKSLRRPARRPTLRERILSSPEDDFIRGLTPRAARELRHLLLSVKARRSGPSQ